MRRMGRGSGCVLQRMWILLLSVVSLTKTTSLRVYDATKSLKDNFFGTCQSNLVRFNGTVDAFLNEPLTHENYLVYRLPISHEELTRYHQIPDIYTWTHYNLSVGLQKGKEQAEAWQKPGAMNWAVRAEHPRQNKSNCIAVSKATVERPKKLYHESRQAVWEMYFLRKRNVLIHDTGIVGSRCGYFQLLEACETRFKFIGKKWWNKCKTQLHQAGVTWEDLFDPVTSPLFTEEVDANGRVVERSLGGAKGTASSGGKDADYAQPFSRRPLLNPLPPIDRYNDTLPWRVIERRNETAKRPAVVQPLPERLSMLCRDHNYISVLTKPWYPHWQYVDGPVLVLTAAWDCNYHHLLIDSLSRIIPILDFIRSSPQMKIHIRRHEIETNSTSYRDAGVALRSRVARFLRIDPRRFISGPVVAKEILVPRAVQCNEPILFPLQMQQLGQTLLQEAEEVMRWELKKAPALQQAYDRTGVYPATFPFAVHQALDYSRVAQDPKRILIQHRSCATNSRVDELTDWRCWTDTTFASVVEAMQRAFPASEILSLTNTNASRSHCLACEIAVYRDVHLLVGVHGAGMTNVMFMPPGRSVLLEITGIFDGRMLPVCGYHGPLAAIYGVHHVIHHYDSKGDAPLVIEDGARRAKDLFVFLGQHAAQQ